jgi:hypothetical protein
LHSALPFIAKRLLLSPEQVRLHLASVSSLAASLLGSVNKDALDSVTSDLCVDPSSDIRHGIDTVAERGYLTLAQMDMWSRLWERASAH